MSMSVIKHKKLNNKEIIILCNRNYKNKYSNAHGYLCVNITNWKQLPHPLNIKSILKMGNFIKEFDVQMCNLIHNEPFIVYIPSSNTISCQMLLTNKSCAGYHFIEEGLANYRMNLYYEPPVKRNFFISILLKAYNLFSSRVQLDYPFLKPYKANKYEPHYYYLDNSIHRINKQHNHILLPLYKEDNNAEFIYNNCVFFISESLLESRFCNENSLRIVLDKTFKKIKNISPIYIKFHPAQKELSRTLVYNVAKKYISNVYIIDDSSSMEQIFIHSTNLKIIGFTSSLLFYANILNPSIEVLNIDNELSLLDKKFNEHNRSLFFLSNQINKVKF